MQTERYDFTEDKLSLTIFTIHEQDEGQYTLTATNGIGQGQATTELVVTGGKL